MNSEETNSPRFMENCISSIKQSITESIPEDVKKITSFTQTRQREIISNFQEILLQSLKDKLPDVIWEEEHKITGRRDSIDIYGKTSDFNIIMELDKPRADQVAKKMLSRIANCLDKPYIYVALCYPGTKYMNPNECVKYFEYGKCLTNKINDKSELIGCIIDKKLKCTFY